MKAKTTSLPYYLATLTIAVLLTLLSSCVKEEEGRRMEMATYDFTATIEPFASEGGQKVRLVNEEWIYWELDDMISIGSDQTTSGDEDCEGWLKIPDNGSDFVGFNGAFMTTLPAGSKYFLGLHPRSMNNRIRATGGSSFSATISLPDTQGFRNDISFAKQVFPMVAWYGGSWDEDHPKPFNLDFHSLAGIVRFQIFNTGAAKTISKVVISSIGDAPRQLKGAFTVEQYNTNTPYLTPAANTAANRTLVLDCGTDGRELGSEILSFYVVLPALGGNGTTTLYPLQFEVHATDGSVCTKRMSAGIPVRRNGITYRNAIDVSDWSDASANVGLSGNGTEERPFRIYTVKDLQYLRNHMAGDRKINNQDVSADMYYCIMRSDIVLRESNWNNGGIVNFVGHITSLANSNTPGITNHSHYPLFASVGVGGVVEGVTVRCDTLNTSFGYGGVSIFCHTNNGTLKDCVLRNVSSKVMVADEKDLGGICVDNHGTIDGCRCIARLSAADHNIGGICLTNYSDGKITGCQVATPFSVTAAQEVGGICHTNNGLIEDSYFASGISMSAASWGGIVFANSGSGAKVKNCFLSPSAHIVSSSSVGGIVHTLSGGTVDYCYLEGQLSSPQLGGIANSVAGGTILNCYVNALDALLTATGASSVVGGIAATLTSGAIKNSFVKEVAIDLVNDGTLGGIVGTVSGGRIVNCYAYESNNTFYGSHTSGKLTNCYLVDDRQNRVASVTTVTSEVAASSDASTGLTAILNKNRTTDASSLSPQLNGSRAWVLTDGTPILSN